MSDQLALYIAAIKREILQDTVLSDCKTFAQLHDYCDANMLGFECLPEYVEGTDMTERTMDFANQAQTAIDQWLRDGMPRYAIMTNTFVSGWVNCSSDDDGAPLTFDTLAEAEQELEDYKKNGEHLGISDDDYQIVKVTK